MDPMGYDIIVSNQRCNLHERTNDNSCVTKLGVVFLHDDMFGVVMLHNVRQLFGSNEKGNATETTTRNAYSTSYIR